MSSGNFYFVLCNDEPSFREIIYRFILEHIEQFDHDWLIQQ